MSLQGGVNLPESKQVLLRQEASLTPCSVEDRAGLTLEVCVCVCVCVCVKGGREGEKDDTREAFLSSCLYTFDRINRSLERCLGSLTVERRKQRVN